MLSLMAGRYAISNERSEASLGANTKGEPCRYTARTSYRVLQTSRWQTSGRRYHVLPSFNPAAPASERSDGYLATDEIPLSITSYTPNIGGDIC